MFCFCFHSPSLKLQALEADSGPHEASVDSQPQGSPAAQHRPLAAEGRSLQLGHKLLLHPPPSPHAQDEHRNEPTQPASSIVHATAALSDGTAGADTLPSPPGPPSSPLLSRFALTDNPIPSPRCPSLSLRFNLDPDAAPSPPCSQHIHMARCSVHADPGDGSVSISVLNRHIHSLRKRIRQFEEHFEQEKHYKPAHNDKTAHPEVSRLMTELIKSRKKLKELKLTQSIECGLRSGVTRRTATDPRGASLTETQLQHVNNNSNPSTEDTVNLINNRLKERRRELGLPEAVKDMSRLQMNMEKTSLQKCLLHFESLHGRPSTRQEWTLVEPFYQRYRLLKHLLLSSAATVITTIEEEEGSDEECTKEPQPPWFQSPRSVFSDEPPDVQPSPPLVSPLEEETALQPQIATVATLHEASRSELLDQLRTTRLEKRRLNRVLREFEDQFCMQSGRTCQKEDRGPMAEEYCQYRNLKAKLRLLEALLSKQKDSATSSRVLSQWDFEGISK